MVKNRCDFNSLTAKKVKNVFFLYNEKIGDHGLSDVFVRSYF